MVSDVWCIVNPGCEKFLQVMQKNTCSNGVNIDIFKVAHIAFLYIAPTFLLHITMGYVFEFKG